MLSYEQALEKIKYLQTSQKICVKSLDECVGYVLAEPVISGFDLPLFTNSAMDGFAVKYEDIDNEKLYVDGIIFAGDPNPDKHQYTPSHTIKIMTGAKLPSWADTVVPVEYVKTIDEQSIKIIKKPHKGANVRFCGEDIKKNTTILYPHTYLTAEKIMLAAAVGYSKLKVFVLPKVFIISTGDEIIEPGLTLKEGQIYNSSKYFLISSFKQLGFNDIQSIHIKDDEYLAQHTLDTIITQAQKDKSNTYFIISTGAVSAGTKDFIPNLCIKSGFEILFHKVAVRPGKPVLLAHKENIIFLGLAGNPISTAVSWYFWIRPILNHISFIPDIPIFKFPLKSDFTKPKNFTCFYRAVLKDGYVEILTDQGSGNYQSSIIANVYVKLPQDKEYFKSQELIDTVLINKLY